VEAGSSKAKPAVSEVKGLIERLAGVFAKAKGKSIGTRKTFKHRNSPPEIISSLAAKYGREVVERMWANFLADPASTEGLKFLEYAWVKFEDESVDLASVALEEIKEAQEKSEREARTKAADNVQHEQKMAAFRRKKKNDAAYFATIEAGGSL
jgi:hypothetical protein